MSKGGLSVLGAEILDGGRLHEMINDHGARLVVNFVAKRIAKVAEDFGGRNIKYGCSKIWANFDKEEDALLSAAEIQRRVTALQAMVSVRVGVCLGHTANEIQFFDDESNNVALQLAGLAEPGGSLISVPNRFGRFLLDGRVTEKRPNVALNCGMRKLGAFEFDWRNIDATKTDGFTIFASTEAPLLLLRFKGRTVALDSNRSTALIGRAYHSDIVLAGEYSSRVHAKIEFRNGAFILVDQSKNGTFVKPEGSLEYPLHNDECILSHRGELSFGEPSTESQERVDYLFV